VSEDSGVSGGAPASRGGGGHEAAWVPALVTAVCALVPASLAAAHVGRVADAAHDAGVASAMGLEAGAWRALDALVASLLAALPVGSRATRAGMGQALVMAAAGATLYLLGRRLAAECAPQRRAGGIAAGIATLAAVCAPAWQLEGSVAAGGATGGLLALLPLAAIAGAEEHDTSRWRLAAFAVGLALAYEPLVGACALASCLAFGAAAPGRVRRIGALRSDGATLVAFLAAGLAMLLLALARARLAGVPLLGALAEGWAGDRGASPPGLPAAFVRVELGPVLGALAVGGAVLAALAPRARPLGAGLVAVVVVGALSTAAGAAAGPTRFGAVVLAAVAAACALAGAAMQAIVGAVADARLPLSRASATMVLLLLLAIPVDEADEALVRSLPRASGAASVWDDVTWGELPPRAVVLVTDPRLWRRATAARATGSLRGDIAVIPTFPHGPPAARALARDVELVPLWRDLELSGAPTEDSLSTLSTLRPVAMAFEPRWGRVLGRHLVPAALLDRFEPEPRGASDRRRALDAFVPKRERLARAASRDPELAQAAAYLLRARALGVAATGDRDLVGRVVEDLHAFAPDDPVATAIVARVVLGKTGTRVEDLRP
jgi:hypothetical protein